MEIERKFLVRELPDLNAITPFHFERYYLSISDDTEERIQKTNSRYSYEKKVAVDSLSRSSEKREITEAEFNKLKSSAGSVIIRDSYTLSPNVSIKIYHGNFEGLIRAEVEFSSIAEAEAYTPEPWMGEEISDSPLGRDSRLLRLDTSTFNDILVKYKPT